MSYKSITKTLLLVTVVVAVFLNVVDAHSRFVCPQPRSSSAGIKTGPCGDQTDDFSGPVTELAPGWNTLVIEETIVHDGSPFRIALTIGGVDDYKNTLLDHVPHNDNNPTNGRYFINVYIPDISCTNCAIQSGNSMTGGESGCTLEPLTCSAYFSCANIKINGTQDPATWQSGFTYAPPQNWPFDDTPSVYGPESATWKDGWIVGIDYNQQPAGACASAANGGSLPPTTTNPAAPKAATPLKASGASAIVANVLLLLSAAFLLF